MKVLITGSSGQLGRAFKGVFEQLEYDVVAWDVEQLDITDGLETVAKITELAPNLIIHCAAYTDVRGCEYEPAKAYQVNWLGTRNIAVAALECDAKLVYISTDYVFDGVKETPYIELDQANPLNVYGRSKLGGEKIIQSLLQKYYIVRTAWLYSETGNNFFRTMARAGAEKRPVSMVIDQRGTPTYVYDLALTVEHLISKPFYGVYHLTNSGACTWYEFARRIFDLLNIEMSIKPITVEQYGDIVKRPANSILNNFNFEQSYGFVLRDWEEALEHCVTRYFGANRG